MTTFICARCSRDNVTAECECAIDAIPASDAALALVNSSTEYAVDFKIDNSEWRRWHPAKDTEADARAYAEKIIKGRSNHFYRIIEIVTTERILSK